jgi:hypothetical protein
MLDTSLQGRAAMLHSNAAAIEKQERDVVKAMDGLRRENDRLGRVAADAAKKVKEIGNVQNWAEVLERDFLVLEETLRLVREGSTESGTGSWDGSGSEGSWTESRDGSAEPEQREDPSTDAAGDVMMEGAPDLKGKGKADAVDDPMDVDTMAYTTTAEAPRLTIPGREPSFIGPVHGTLEEELQNAMSQPIGEEVVMTSVET